MDAPRFPPAVERAVVSTCSVCDRSSAWHAAFTTVKDGTVQRRCCPACAARIHARWRRIRTVVIWTGLALFAYNHLLHGSDGVGLFAFGLITFYALQMPLAFLHELGHVVAARLLGAPPYAVITGHEPWIVDREVLGVRWRLGAMVGGGVTYHDACDGRYARLRAILITLAGPLVNLAIAVIAFTVFESMKLELRGPIPGILLVVLGAASAMQFLVNLWPHAVATPAGNLPSDGARVLGLLRGPSDDVRMVRGARHYLDAWFAFNDGNLERAAASCARAEPYWLQPPLSQNLAVLRSAVLIKRGDAQAAIILLRSVEATADSDGGVRAIVANNLACALLLIDDAQSQAEALRMTAEASALAPWEPSIIGTRACLLAVTATRDNGHAAQALALLDARGERNLTRKQRAWTAVTRGFVAIAEGDVEQARGCYENARSLDAGAAPLRLLERRIPSH